MRAALVTILIAGCGSEAVLVRVEDPEGVASSADRIVVGADPKDGEEVPLGRIRFPLTFTLVGEGTGIVTVEARAGDVAVARGSGDVAFAPNAAPIAIELRQLCEEVTECKNHSFCRPKICSDGLCGDAPDPCPAVDDGCVRVTCIEESRACEVDDARTPGCSAGG